MTTPRISRYWFRINEGSMLLKASRLSLVLPSILLIGCNLSKQAICQDKTPRATYIVRSIGNSFRINTGETQARCLHHNALHHNAHVRVQDPQRRLVRAGLSRRAARVAPAVELANAHPLDDSASACKFSRQVLGRVESRALKQGLAYLSKPNLVGSASQKAAGRL